LSLLKRVGMWSFEEAMEMSKDAIRGVTL